MPNSWDLIIKYWCENWFLVDFQSGPFRDWDTASSSKISNHQFRSTFPSFKTTMAKIPLFCCYPKLQTILSPIWQSWHDCEINLNWCWNTWFRLASNHKNFLRNKFMILVDGILVLASGTQWNGPPSHTPHATLPLELLLQNLDIW